MADIRREGCSTQSNAQTGIVCAFTGQQRPHTLSRTPGRRKGWWPGFPLLAAVALLLAGDRWQLGYNIEVASAEKRVYVGAGTLQPQRRYEQKRIVRGSVPFDGVLQHDDNKTQGQSGVESRRSPASTVSFQEIKKQDRGPEDQKLQKEGALRRQTERAQKAAAYSNVENHSASVGQHDDRTGVHERESSESSKAAAGNTPRGELESDGVKSGQRHSRVGVRRSLASVKKDTQKFKESRKKRTTETSSSGRSSVSRAGSASSKRSKKGSHQHGNELQAGETEAR